MTLRLHAPDDAGRPPRGGAAPAATAAKPVFFRVPASEAPGAPLVEVMLWSPDPHHPDPVTAAVGDDDDLAARVWRRGGPRDEERAAWEELACRLREADADHVGNPPPPAPAEEPPGSELKILRMIRNDAKGLMPCHPAEYDPRRYEAFARVITVNANGSQRRAGLSRKGA